MNIVLLSGGSGKRLWPLSNDILSKQFLKLLKDERGEYESMLQRVARNIMVTHPNANVFISSNTNQSEIIKQQLGAIEIILEPSRRGTFPAIALAAAYLHYNKQMDEEETFVVCPIDTFADIKYFELLKEVDAIVSKSGKDIGLMGIIPSYPSSKYGYILKENGEVTGFVEKPPEHEAERLINGGALWNGGVFALKIGYVLEHAKKIVHFDNFEGLYGQYDLLPKISFDCEIVETAISIECVQYDGKWKDLGTWNTLTEEMSNNFIGKNVLVSENCENTHILNMLNIPVVAQDLKDTVVVASHDGFLVSSKQGSSYLKPLVEDINQRPMYEQRSWGNYRVLDYKQDAEKSTLIKRVRINAGRAINYQYHTKYSEVWTIVSGKGILTLEGVDSIVSPGSVVQIPLGAKHKLLVTTDLELIEIQMGKGELNEDDVIQVSE